MKKRDTKKLLEYSIIYVVIRLEKMYSDSLEKEIYFIDPNYVDTLFNSEVIVNEYVKYLNNENKGVLVDCVYGYQETYIKDLDGGKARGFQSKGREN